MHKLLRPYHLLLAAGLLTAFLSLFCKAGEIIDIHVHDTYFIIGAKHIFLAPSFLLLLLWLFYTGVYGILLSNKLTWLHVIITIVTIAFIITILLWTVFYYKSRFIDFSAFRQFQIQNTITAVSVLLLIAGQLLFIMNLVGGIISWLRKRKSNFK